VKKINFLTVLATLLLVTTVSTHAADMPFKMVETSEADRLVSWQQTFSENMEGKGCVTIPGTPGTPQHCTPGAPKVCAPDTPKVCAPDTPKVCTASTNVPYPCPTWSNPVKMCNHNFAGVCTPSIAGLCTPATPGLCTPAEAGVCTPAIPGIPQTQVCGGNTLGQLSVTVEGGVSPVWEIAGLFAVLDNEVKVDAFGQKVTFPMQCVVPLGVALAPICLDLMTGEISSAGHKANCKKGVTTGGIEYKGLAAKVCASLNIDNKDFGSLKGFAGSVEIMLETQVALGSVTVAGHEIRLASKVWNPKMVVSNFVFPPTLPPDPSQLPGQ
jgi:hypothetical protein